MTVAKLMWPMLLLLPSVLNAQAPEDEDRPSNRGMLVGVTGFTGGQWQPSGIDIGIVRALGSAPGRSAALSLRLGSFVQDDAVIYGRSTGFFIAALVGVRTPLVTIAEVGTGQNPSSVRFVGVVEVGGSGNFRSPLPQGKAMATAAALAGISFSSGTGGVDQGFAFLLGPAVFAGRATTTHLQVSLRYQN